MTHSILLELGVFWHVGSEILLIVCDRNIWVLWATVIDGCGCINRWAIKDNFVPGSSKNTSYDLFAAKLNTEMKKFKF